MNVKEKIARTAGELFRKYGIKTVTMDRVAREAGVSKRTIYEKYRDKVELIQDCVVGHENEIKSGSLQIIQKSANVIMAIFNVAEMQTRILQDINPNYYLDTQKYYPNIWESEMNRINETRYNEIYKLLRKGINEGIFRKNINITITAKIIVETLSFILREDFYFNKRHSIQELLDNVTINFIRGISTEKGMEIIEEHRTESFSDLQTD